MIPKRGEIWVANLNPVRGSEQAGVRPVLICQSNVVQRYTTTVVTIPFTTNLRRASLPSCWLVRSNEGGLDIDSVALCHQIRAIDKMRLQRNLGVVDEKTMAAIDGRVLYAFGIFRFDTFRK